VLGRFRHYRNLALTEARLRQLLREFQFAPMLSVINSLQPANTTVGQQTPALPYVW
jgi:hypothetical protein